MKIGDVHSNPDEPRERMGRLGEAMITALEAHPEYGETVQGIVMLMDSAAGGVVTFGYDEDEAIDALLGYLEALCKATGRPLTVIPVGRN